MQPTFLFGLVVVFSVCLELHVQCQKICVVNQYTIVNSTGSFLKCLNCATCHPGRGLYPICGSTITDPPDNIDCKSCPAETFSDQLDSAPCHSCQTCTDHEIVAAPCTNVSDRTCSGTCEKGYFFAIKAPHNCQQCSYCCFDGKDEKQPECIKQGLNATGRHCSARLDKQCGPKPTTAVTTPGTQRPTTHLSTHQQNNTTPNPTTAVKTPGTQRLATTHLSIHQQNTTSLPVHHPTKHHNYTVTIIVLSVLSGLFLVALLLVLFKRKSLICGRKRTETHSPDIEITGDTDEANRANRTQRNNDDYASQGPQSAAYNPRVQELQINTGYASSNSATPEASPCVSPQHTDDELDELRDVADERKKRLVKRQSSRESQSNASKDGASESLLVPKVDILQPNGNKKDGKDDELDELREERKKRCVKRQSSRESQSNASKDGASESLLDPKVDVLQPNGNKKDGKGGEQGRSTVSRRQSFEALKRKFSSSFEKDYQPLGGEDPDELLVQGGEQGRSTVSRRQSLEALKRKFSLSLEKDYQPLGGEDPDELPVPGNDEDGSKMCSPDSSFIASLKRKCSLPVKEEDTASTTLTEPIKIEVEPKYQEQKEGSRVEFMCNVHGKSEVFYNYRWSKDGMEIQGQNNSTLVLECVEMRHFGCYECKVSDADGPCGCVKSELDVVPRDGMDYRCLGAICPDTQERVETLLTKKIHGLGGWRQVAYKYSMDDLNIDSLEEDPKAGKTLISYLKAKNPDLKVYEFCKTLKESNIRRFDIIKELSGHLSVPSSEDTA